MKKTNIIEDAWNRASGHHILGVMSHMLDYYICDSNHPSFIKYELQGKPLKVIMKSDYQAVIFVNKRFKQSEEDWTFMFLMFFSFFALDVYKKLHFKEGDKKTEQNKLLEHACLCYCASYIQNNFNVVLPDSLKSLNDLIGFVSFKNESATIEDFKFIKDSDHALWSKIKSIVFSPDLMFSIEKNEYAGINAKKAFSEYFIDHIVSQAKRTFQLKDKLGKTQDQIENEDSPVYKARKYIVMNYPLLSSLASHFKIIYDIPICRQFNISIGAVNILNETILINPAAGLNQQGLIFVIAHEMLHVALNHHQRRRGRDHLIWNLACDFVINSWLIEMGVGLPPDSIYVDSDLKGLSADEIYNMIAKDSKLMKKMGTLKDRKAGLGDQKSCDIIYDEKIGYFANFEDACKQSLLRGLQMHQEIGRGLIPAGLEEEIKVLNQPPIPWQVELADWFARNFPLEEKIRSYARASRRQSSSPDIPIPYFRKQEYERMSKTFGIILDTSGSMDPELIGKCLGAISSYAQAQDVEEVRLIFCDAQPYDEGYILVKNLVNKIMVKGRGGTVIQKAINYLEMSNDFPKNAPILILTDGFIENEIKITRTHAYCVPNRYNLPFQAKDIFEFK